MDIKKTGFLNKIFGIQKKQNVSASQSVKKDSVHISDEARRMAEVNKYKQILKEMPAVRTEKIAEIKEKLQSEYYKSEEIHKSLADKLSDFLEI